MGFGVAHTYPEHHSCDEPDGEDMGEHAVRPRLHIAEGQLVKVLQQDSWDSRE
jgi:hypothetical protein